MRSKKALRILLSTVICFTIVFPVAAFASSGKKYFKEGMRYAAESKWDMAAEQFALALNKEPANPQYKLQYIKSLTNASLMFMERGRAFEEQHDYSSAYQGYRQAYSYDRTNEMAETKMKKMYEAQWPQQAAVQKNITAVSFDGKVISKTVDRPRTKPVEKNYEFRRTTLKLIIDTLSEELRLNVLYDSEFKDRSDVTFKLDRVNPARALDLLLLTNKLFYAQADTRTIIIVPDSNQQIRARYQELFVRTFYLKNADITELRTLIQQSVGSKFIAPSKNLNALTIRDTAANLSLIERIIASVDKSPAEVLIDVNMYEVSRNDLLQIGNGFVSEGTRSLSNIGGLFQPTVIKDRDKDGKVTSILNPILQNAPQAIFGGPAGLALAVPATTMAFLQTRGNTKLLNSAQVRAFENQKTTTRIGQRVPIQTASVFPFGSVGQTNQQTQGQGAAQNSLFNSGFPQIQYQDVGLVLDLEPKVSTSGDVQMKLKVESTGVVSGPNPLTPIFTQRSMEGTAQTLDGQTALIAGVLQTNETNSRSGVPLVGLLPVLGNFFSLPKRGNDRSDIIVTVTPHILRGAEVDDVDKQPHDSGQAQNPEAKVSLQEIVDRADDLEYLEQKNTQTAAARETQPAVVPPGPKTVTISNGSTSAPQPPPEPTPTAGRRVPSAELPRVPAQQPVPAAKSKSPDPDDEESDDEDEPADAKKAADKIQKKAVPNDPVQVTVRVSNPDVKVGGLSIVTTVVVGGANEIKSAEFVLTYNTNVLQLKAVRDGGLMRYGGVNPEVLDNPEGGGVSVRISRPPDASGAPTSGLILVLLFEAVNPGDSEINVDPARSSLHRLDGQPVTLRVSEPARVSVKQ